MGVDFVAVQVTDGYCLTGALCEGRGGCAGRAGLSWLSSFSCSSTLIDQIDQRNRIDQISATRCERGSGTSCWPEYRLTTVSGARIITT